MKRKPTLILVVCSIFFLMTAIVNVHSSNGISFWESRIKGNGVLTEKERGVMAFNAIQTKGAVDVIIADVTNAPIKVRGDENLVDLVETYVKDGVLYVQFKENQNYTSKLGLKVTVPNNGLINKITASGASDVIANGCIISDNMYISCTGSSDFIGNVKAKICEFKFSGSSDFKGNVEAEKCTVSCTGSSDCVISGKANECIMSMSGSSDFKGYGFVVNKLNCNASGSSDVQITCNEELSVTARGSCDVYYKGAAKVILKDISGSSSLKNR